MADEKTPARGLRSEDKRQSALRDTRGGTYDPPSESAPPLANQHRTARQDRQPGADVRPDTTAEHAELPEGLRHRSDPLNKSSGRRDPDQDH